MYLTLTARSWRLRVARFRDRLVLCSQALSFAACPFYKEVVRSGLPMYVLVLLCCSVRASLLNVVNTDLLRFISVSTTFSRTPTQS